MKEKDLIDLGFERTDVSAEESGNKVFHYYTLDFSKGFSLITNASDELLDGKWYAEVFEAEEVRFLDKKELEEFINIIKRNLIE